MAKSHHFHASSLRLQARDLAILAEVFNHRALSRDHMLRFEFFKSVPRANSRLKQLEASGYLRRHFGDPRLGSQSVFTIGLSAIEPLTIAGFEEDEVRRLARQDESPALLHHTLAEVDFELALRLQASRFSIGIEVWLSESQCLHEYEIRTTSGWQRSVIKPDGFFALSHGDCRRCYFIEVDRGTVSSEQFKTKVMAYKRYASGPFQDVYDSPEFEVLVITTSESRISKLRELAVCGKPVRTWFSTFAEVESAGPFSRIWRAIPGSGEWIDDDLTTPLLEPGGGST